MAPEPLRALLADVGGTLVNDQTWVEPARYEGLMLTRLSEAFGVEHPWFQRLVTQPFSESDAPPWEQRTVEGVSAFLAGEGIDVTDEEVATICRACAVPLPEVVELAPGAAETIRELHRRGVVMVVCSNTFWRNDDDVRRDGEQFGLDECFAGYVTSHDAGVGKPHPAIFHRALAAAGATPSTAAIIGDRPERDLAGARALGMRSIWMRPRSFRGDPDPPPDATVDSWPQVIPVIEKWML
jgi:HAD superfamily hydrolase (TIGR01509 family)